MHGSKHLGAMGFYVILIFLVGKFSVNPERGEIVCVLCCCSLLRPIYSLSAKAVLCKFLYMFECFVWI